MKKLVLILIVFMFFACDNGTSNNNGSNNINNDYDIGIVDENIVGNWYDDENTWFIFNSDGSGFRYYDSFNSEDVYTSYREFFWGVKENLICIRYLEGVNCYSFNVTDNILIFYEGSFKKVEDKPVLRSKK